MCNTIGRTEPVSSLQPCLRPRLNIQGQNVACDAGTYLYSGEGIWRNGLAHTAVHNTVTVDYLDQMKMLTRFTGTDCSHGEVLRHDESIWEGEHDGYRRLPDPVSHKRTIVSLGEDRWLIVDHLTAIREHHYALHWLLKDGAYGVQELAPAYGLVLFPSNSKLFGSKVNIQLGLLEGSGSFSVVRAAPDSTRGWRSQYYGVKEPAISVLLETDRPRACFWSYFGEESDSLQTEGRYIHIHSHDSERILDLTSPGRDVTSGMKTDL